MLITRTRFQGMRFDQYCVNLHRVQRPALGSFRLSDVYDRADFGPHHFNEHLVAEFFDTEIEKFLRPHTPFSIRFFFFAYLFLSSTARTTTLFMDHSGTRVFERTIASILEKIRVPGKRGECDLWALAPLPTRGFREARICGERLSAADVDLAILDVSSVADLTDLYATLSNITGDGQDRLDVLIVDTQCRCTTVRMTLLSDQNGRLESEFLLSPFGTKEKVLFQLFYARYRRR